MKVTVDTRHDSLEEALATVRAAFGSSRDTPNAGGGRRRTSNVADGNARTAKRARSAGRASVGPATKSSPATSTAATRTSGRTGRKRTSSMSPSSNIAPPGQADAIRAWARAQGMEVKQAGRLSAAVIQAYQESPRS